MSADDREYPEPDREVDAVSVRELFEQIESDDLVSVLDVRDRPEFEAWRVDGPAVRATQVPFNRFVAAEVTGDVSDLVSDLNEPVVVVCARGDASAYVAALLEEAGVEAANLEEGMEGWARLLVARELDADAGDARVVQFRRPSSGCLSYLVHDDATGVVVDPLRAFVSRYEATAKERGVDLRYVVDTHVHADHVSGVRDLADATGAEAALPAGARDRGLTDPERFRFVTDGDELDLSEVDLTAVALPGHTTEMTGVRVGEVLLSGDSVFIESVARPDLEDGDEGAPELASALYDTLERVFSFPGDVVVAPGHDGPGADPALDGTYSAPLSALRERLSVFESKREAFVETVCSGMPPQPANFERVIDANLGRVDIDDAEAFELELGPNNCAVGWGGDATAD